MIGAKHGCSAPLICLEWKDTEEGVIRGLVVELGFVNDLTEARILSWAAGTYLDALVVANSTIGKALYDKGIKTLPLDQMIPFKFIDRFGTKRSRNDEELQRQELPLGIITLRNERNEEFIPPGNPRYLVNLIRLPYEQEYLRDTVFFTIYGRGILFQDMQSALAYRKQLIKMERNPPSLYTLSGDRMVGQGLLDPGKNNTLPSTELDYLYGEEPGGIISSMGIGGGGSRAEYHTSEKEIELLEEIIILQQQKQQLYHQQQKVFVTMPSSSSSSSSSSSAAAGDAGANAMTPKTKKKKQGASSVTTTQGEDGEEETVEAMEQELYRTIKQYEDMLRSKRELLSQFSMS